MYAMASRSVETCTHTEMYLCPALAKMIINCYRQATDLMVSGNVLLSEEGATQGDPLAMPFYALATIPLIRELSEKCSARQVCFADDSAAACCITKV